LQNEPASWSVDIGDAIVTGVGQLEIIVEVPDQRVLQLLADDAVAHANWMAALQQAASRKIDSFYTIGRELGHGPFSKVVMATHRKSCKQYIIKSIDKRAHLVNFSETELKAMRMVDHPNLVKTIDFFDTKDKVYIVSEYLKGGSLYDSVAKQEFVTEQMVSLVMRELLKTVNYLHQDGFCHRNIKPANLLCANTMFPQSVKLADFGFAPFMEKACECDDYFESKTRALVTAPHYTAPEILYGSEGFDQSIDIWSCGVILYALLSGTLPFPGKDKREVSKAIQNSDGVSFPDAQWKNVSPEAKDLVSCLLQKTGSQRITAAAALQHPWVASDNKDNRVVLADLKVLPKLPNMVWDHAKPSRLYSLDSSVSQASEGTFVISSETHRQMGVQKTKLMYGGKVGRKAMESTDSADATPVPRPTQRLPALTRSNSASKSSQEQDTPAAIEKRASARSSRNVGRSSRGMSRLSRGLKKNATFALFSRDKKTEEPSEYW